MRVIDVHTHLGDAGTEQVRLNGINYTPSGLLNEMKHADISYSGLMFADDENYSTFK